MAVVFDNNVNITVEIAFDSNPLVSSQTWTNRCKYCMRSQTKWRRLTNLTAF